MSLERQSFRLEAIAELRDELEARQDAIWIDYMDAMHRWREWQAEAEQLKQSMARLGETGGLTKDSAK